MFHVLGTSSYLLPLPPGTGGAGNGIRGKETRGQKHICIEGRNPSKHASGHHKAFIFGFGNHKLNLHLLHLVTVTGGAYILQYLGLGDSFTLPKFNSSPLKNHRNPIGKDRLSNHHFSGAMSVKLRGCNCPISTLRWPVSLSRLLPPTGR